MYNRVKEFIVILDVIEPLLVSDYTI